MGPYKIFDGTRNMNIWDLIIGHFDYGEDGEEGRPITTLGKNVRKVGEDKVGQVGRIYLEDDLNSIYVEVFYPGKVYAVDPRKVPQSEFKNYELVPDEAFPE
jgi:hypothetical protein